MQSYSACKLYLLRRESVLLIPCLAYLSVHNSKKKQLIWVFHKCIITEYHSYHCSTNILWQKSPLQIKSAYHQLSNWIQFSLTWLMFHYVKQLLKHTFSNNLLHTAEKKLLAYKNSLPFLCIFFFSPKVVFSNTFLHYCKKTLFVMEVYDRTSSKTLRKSLWKMLWTYMMKASLSPSNACDGITFTGRWVNDLKKKEKREERIVRHEVSFFTDCTLHKETVKLQVTLFCLQFFVPLGLDPFITDFS